MLAKCLSFFIAQYLNKNVPVVLTLYIFCAKMNILIEKGSVLYG